MTKTYAVELPCTDVIAFEPKPEGLGFPVYEITREDLDPFRLEKPLDLSAVVGAAMDGISADVEVFRFRQDYFEWLTTGPSIYPCGLASEAEVVYVPVKRGVGFRCEATLLEESPGAVDAFIAHHTCAAIRSVLDAEIDGVRRAHREAGHPLLIVRREPTLNTEYLAQVDKELWVITAIFVAGWMPGPEMDTPRE
jgi:hypothetical protein